jgi:hypothetical protein
MEGQSNDRWPNEQGSAKRPANRQILQDKVKPEANSDEARLEENHKLVASRRYSSLKNSSIEL